MVSLNPLNWFSSKQKDNVLAVDDLNPWAYLGQDVLPGFQESYFTGDKFPGGFGVTQLQIKDYWTLRARSAELFNNNLYAVGLIRRLITNEINTGLSPEATPNENILGLDESTLNDWSENVENRFQIWAKNPRLCDFHGVDTFGAIQRNARREAFIEGDVLVVLRNSQRTRLPQVQIIRGSHVQTPYGGDVNIRRGHKVKHGVEFDTVGRVVAHWVVQADQKFKRIPAFGERSGRRISWLVYGTEKRLDEVRGQPLLALILQSLKEIDRYRDSAQRKAVINSIIAMYIEKTEDKMSTLPLSGGAVRKDKGKVTDSDGKKRNYTIANQIPGMVLEELQTGEKPVGFRPDGTDINFGAFEEAIIQAVAWANEIPPEILRLAFSNNYSASQAAINEFKIYINRVWSEWGENFCTPIFEDWLLSEVLLRKISAPGLLDSWRDPSQYDIFGAWTLSEWYGSIKPSTDMLKQGKGSELLVKNGWSTNAREARVTTGTKFSQNVKRLKRENEQLAEAARPMAEFRREFGDEAADAALARAPTPTALDATEVEAMIEDYLEDRGAAGGS